MPRFINGLP